MKTSEISKYGHDRLILMFFFGFLVQKYIKKHIKHSDSPLLLKFFFQFSIEMQKCLLPVQQNLDVMEKNGCQIRIQRPKKHRK